MPNTDRIEKDAIKAGNAKIHRDKFKELAHITHQWDAVIEYGLKLEDALKPEFWSLISNRLIQHDEVRARAEDGSWIAYLIVVECGRGFAKMQVDRVVTLDEIDPMATQANLESGFEIIWRGVHHKFAVRRKRDKTIMKEGFQTKAAAQQWLNENLRTLAA